MKKSKLLILSGVAVLSLAGCGGEGTSDSSLDSSGGTSTSTAARYLEVTIEHNTIPAGSTFFDAANPTVLYHDNGEVTDYTNYSNYVTFELTNLDTNETFTAGDALTAGSYEATITCRSRTDTVEFTVSNDTPEAASEGNGYKSYYHDDFAGLEVSAHNALGTLGPGKFPAYGTPKMLVIPVIFSDMVGQYDFTEAELGVIEAAFFGEASETGWESLKSYYLKSSYGLLDIQGHVADPYVTSLTVAEADRQSIGASHQIVTAATNDYFTKHPDESRSDYDYNGDGFIDGVNIIYKTTAQDTSENPNASDIWWNYTTVIDPNGTTANVTSPVANRYFWSEYDMIRSGYYEPNIDAHTIIHENGHLMGISDYYSYDRDPQTNGALEAAAGCSDMMDMNVGDHNGYSKMLYNWLATDDEANGVHLKVVDGSSDNFTITLNSFSDTGDLLLVRNTVTDTWNETPYDEYLILQYYTPTGVNEKDSSGYPEWSGLGSHGGTYANPGLQVFHVDNRLGAQVGTYHTEGGRNIIDESHYEYVDEIQDTAVYNEDGTFVGASTTLTSNTGSESREIIDGALHSNSSFRELSAILPGGVNSLKSSTYYNSFGQMANLFGTDEYADEIGLTERERYGGTTYSNYKMRDFYANDLLWNDGTEFNWNFSVIDQTDDSITLHFVDLSAI